MIEKYTTKRDINGNRYTLIIDHDRKTYKRDYNPWDYSEYKTIGKRERERRAEELEKAGYTREF